MYIIERDQPVVVTDVLIEATSYEVENNSFTWSVSEDGNVILENTSGLTVEIAQNVRYFDGLSEMLTTSRDSSRVPVDSGDLVTKSFVSSWDATPDLGVVTGDSSGAVAEGEPENPSNLSSVTAAQFVTDETYGTVIDVDSGPLPEEERPLASVLVLLTLIVATERSTWVESSRGRRCRLISGYSMETISGST